MDRRRYTARRRQSQAYWGWGALLVLLFLMAAAALAVAIAAMVINNNRASDFRHDNNQIRQAVGFSVAKNSTQNVASGTAFTIDDWAADAGAPLYDATNGALNLTSGIFTTAVAGQYIATGHICWPANNTDGIRIVQLITDGPGFAAGVVVNPVAAANVTTLDQCVDVTQVMDLPVGTTVEITLLHDAASDVAVGTSSLFSMERITHKV